MRNIEMIFSSGGNHALTQLAIDKGFLTGCQLPNNTLRHPLHFADQNWKSPNLLKYTASVARYRPVWATVIDIETLPQYSTAIAWATAILPYVQKGVIFIPKVKGVMHLLPYEMGDHKLARIGYSVPTRHGKTLLPLRDFYDRPLHLLGGHPMEQRILANSEWFNVESFDQNYIQKVAIRGKRAFDGEKFIQCPREMSYSDVLALSLEGVARLWN